MCPALREKLRSVGVRAGGADAVGGRDRSEYLDASEAEAEHPVRA